MNTLNCNDIPNKFSKESLYKLGAFFRTVQEYHKLTKTKDNIYINPEGDRFYLDEFGFHPVEQFKSSTLIKIVKKLQADIAKVYSKYDNIKKIEEDRLKRKSKAKLNEILTNKALTDKEKVQMLDSYLNNK